MEAHKWGTRAIFSVALPLLVLPACGSDGPSTSAKTTNTIVAKGSTSETTQVWRGTRGLKDVWVAITCDGGMRLTVLAASDGKSVAETTITFPDGATPTYDCGANPYYLRQIFDQNFTRVAVKILKLDEGASHIGYIDISTGRLIDLDVSSPTSFNTAPQHENPVFEPHSEQIWFHDRTNPQNEAILHIDPSGGPAAQSGYEIRSFEYSKFAVGTRYVMPFNGDDGGAIPSPDGSLLARLSFVPGDFRKRLNIAKTPWSKDPQAIANAYRDLGEPITWIDDTHVLAYADSSSMQSPQASAFAVVTLNAEGTHVLSVERLLQNNDRRNFSPVVSPDHKRISFLSGRGADVGVYLSLFPPDGQVRRIAASSVGELLAWI